MQFPRIRNLREDHDLKQVDLAAYLHVGQATYSDYEIGKITAPIEILMKLAQFYHVSLNYLTGLSEQKRH